MSEMIQMTFNDEPDLTGPKSFEAPGTVAEGNTCWSDDLDAPTREFVQQKTDEIHGQLKRTAEGIIRIGQNLIAVKEWLHHGQFLSWLEAEFEMKERSARNFMQVAHRFGDKSAKFTDLPLSILYALAAPSTSEEVVDKVLSGEMEATLVSIKAAKEAEKRRADKAESAKQEVEQQMQLLRAEVATLQRQLEEQPQVVEKTVENPETEAALASLREKYAQKEEQLRIKTERVAALGAELDKHAHRDEQETYRQQIRYKWRQACDVFSQGIKGGIARMVTPLDAASAFEGDDWARLAEVLSTLEHAAEALISLRESVRSQFVDASVDP